jgi:sialic acid synthase SpsE
MVKIAKEIQIDGRKIGSECSTYFIADIAANHDGDLERAKDLIYLSAEAGADAAKFQHFDAKTIISDFGFKDLDGSQSHQTSWGKSVFKVYADASVNLQWTTTLKETCGEAGITFLTSPYSFDLIDHADNYIPAFKIGSGDITWLDALEYMAKKGKPMLLATGATTTDEVATAVNTILALNPQLILMQCNTNYTASLENFKYINLNVLKTYASMFPDVILGLSDHTPGSTTVLGAIALGAKVIEKHFTDDNDREGPDHKFSMNPVSWKEMVDLSRELESALGCGVKKVEDNEKETVVLQRRSIRTSKKLIVGSVISEDDIEMLRPCPEDGIAPYDKNKILGKVLVKEVPSGQHLKWSDLQEIN